MITLCVALVLPAVLSSCNSGRELVERKITEKTEIAENSSTISARDLSRDNLAKIATAYLTDIYGYAYMRNLMRTYESYLKVYTYVSSVSVMEYGSDHKGEYVRYKVYGQCVENDTRYQENTKTAKFEGVLQTYGGMPESITYGEIAGEYTCVPDGYQSSFKIVD